MGFTRVEPGLRWRPSKRKDSEGRTLGTAKLEVIKPGTKGHARKRVTLERTTLGSAQRRLEEERARFLGDQAPPPETFGEFLDRHAEECLARVGPRTRRTYGAAIANHLRPFFGSTKLSSFAKTGEYEVGRFVQAMRRKRKLKFLRGQGVAEGAALLAPQTVNGALRLLRLLLNHARKAGFIAALPSAIFKPLEEPARDHTPRLHELRAFFGTFEEGAFRAAYARRMGLEPSSESIALAYERYRALRPFFVAAAETGFRRGDLLALMWRSVDLEAGTVRIVMLKTGKTAIAAITRSLREALLELRARRVVSKEHVFLGLRGRPLSATSVRRAFQLGVELSGIGRRLKLHGLRHALGYRLAASGVPLYLIQSALGHTDARTTAVYLGAAGEHVGITRQALEASSWEP